MREWKFENGIRVEEREYDHNLHCFAVYAGDRYLGSVYPDLIGDMKSCIEELDDGYDPITSGWEDGMGNVCNIDGWS